MIKTKREIIGSIFPEKLEFDGRYYRTARMNIGACCIFHINNELIQNKNRTNENKFHLSCLVGQTEQMSNYFVQDLEHFADFKVGISTPKVNFQN